MVSVVGRAFMVRRSDNPDQQFLIKPEPDRSTTWPPIPLAMSGIARSRRSSMPSPTTSVRQEPDPKISSSVSACGVPGAGRC